MQQLLTILHILAAVFLIGLVLIQKGKGGDMGAGFGAGASQTMFGSAGATPFLVKLTGTLAFVFFITCGALSFFLNKHVPAGDLIDPIPIAGEPAKTEPMIPTDQPSESIQQTFPVPVDPSSEESESKPLQSLIQMPAPVAATGGSAETTGS